MEIRTYRHEDRTSVINLLKLNTPEFFHPAEQKDLEHYLDHEVEDYFVVEDSSKIIGAGGINYFPEDKTARISWDIIDPDAQGKGVGTALTQYRIEILQTNPMIDLIVVRTTQLVYGFYEKMGFELEKVEKDYWAKNFDLYQMVLEIRPGANPK